MMGTAVKYVAALNVDTKLVKFFVYAVFRESSRVEVVGSAYDHIEFVYPAIGRLEIDPAKLWSCVITTIKTAFEEANLTADQIAFLAISCHQGSFTCWNRSNGMVYHNFITAQDLRADQMTKDCNENFMFKAFKSSASFLHCFTRSQRYLNQSLYEVTNEHVTMRLAWMLENSPGIKQDLPFGNVLFGGIDAWLLYRFRQGIDPNKKVEHISDVTSCVATGFYDPFTQDWADWAAMLYPIEASLEITQIANSSAALWGTCCFEKSELYIKMDTAAVLNIVTKASCLASTNGMTPMIAHKTVHPISDHEEVAYVLQKICTDCTTVVDWALKIGLFTEPREGSSMASSVSDSNGVFFIPAFSVFGVRDITAGSSFIGIKKSTRKEHLIRALFESLVYRIALLYVSALKEIEAQNLEEFTKIKVDGTVSQIDFICQMLADTAGLPVERSDTADASALGAVFVAGINLGFFRNKPEVMRIRKVDKTFAPNPNNKLKLLRNMRCWEEVVEKFKV
ncbi:glycerol kinase [Culex quinquefasciatus]|uniref:glycerol kinase n=1 Tax=Culex quinquefasciatus TaxID=7176 RepID=B0VZT7_CULQU|nr:glycerol kinase [Culex quinquefasciatus]|eukprot:XP_001841971.1 glycerol kinase [Culex quinquefasciatus]